MRTASYFGLVNLGISNIFMAIIYPITSIIIYLAYFALIDVSVGVNVACGFCVPAVVSCVIVANGSLAFIAVERCCMITKSITRSSYISQPKAILTLSAIWVIAILPNWPRAILTIDETSLETWCLLYTNSIATRTSLLTFSSVAIILLLIIVLICHILISKRLKIHQKTIKSWNRISVRAINTNEIRTTSILRIDYSLALLRKVTILQFIFDLLWLLSIYGTVLGHAARFNSNFVGLMYNLQYFAVILAGLQSPIAHFIAIERFRIEFMRCCKF
ncbi:hypothetical protein TrispH2_004198 [Trichoplax sp. H2]|nr:hypothetical protein TrispH2_004198 [Trichoplax sp. H2]|eukprot:RDD44008.1 hypothetical protein TrispH2_004198 [Trichoplax sp. H2]